MNTENEETKKGIMAILSLALLMFPLAFICVAIAIGFFYGIGCSFAFMGAVLLVIVAVLIMAVVISSKKLKRN